MKQIKEADETVYSQMRLIENFNAFVDQANVYCGINKIAALKKTGTCFSLTQYYIKFFHDGKIENFYLMVGYIANHYTAEKIAQHLAQAKFREIDELNSDGVIVKILRYDDFKIPMPSTHIAISFSELFKFIQSVSRAQSGYLKVKSTSRFAQSVALRSLGRFESINGIWEDCYPMLCNSKNVENNLYIIHLQLHQFAVITSGNHAIGFQRVKPSVYEIYDPNQPAKPKKLYNFNEVGKSILVAFKATGCIKDIDRGYVALSVQTVSFGISYQHLDSLIGSFRDNFLNRITSGDIAKSCLKIILSQENRQSYSLVIACRIYNIYLELKETDSTMNIDKFLNLLPDAQKMIVRECIHLMRRGKFPEFIENNSQKEQDLEQIGPQHKVFIESLNAYLSQYQDGHLSRCDLAVNMCELMSQQEQYGGLPKSEYLLNLKEFLTGYLEGAVTSGAFITTLPANNLHIRDDANFSIAHIAFLESPNLATIRALFNRFKNLPEKFGSIDVDKGAAGIVLQQACPDEVEFLMPRIDMSRIIEDPDVLCKPFQTGNLGVIAVLLKHLPDQVIK